MATLDQAIASLAIQSEIDKARAEHESKQAAVSQAKDNLEAEKSKPVLPVPPAVSEPEKYRQQRLQALQGEVGTLQHRFQGWQFVIPEYKYANMVKSLDDLLKPPDNKSASPVNAKTSSVGTKH